MDSVRRRLLKATGTGIGAVATLGAISSSVSADPADAWEQAHSSNFHSRNPSQVDWIVVHYTAAPYQSAINTFKNGNSNVSAHYNIRNSDGHCTKMVNDEHGAAWHAGDRWMNTRSVGIEHEWVEGQNGFSEASLQKSAEIVHFLADKYDIPLEYYDGAQGDFRNHSGGIIEHRQVTATPCPGPDWDADRYMQFVGGDDGGSDPAFQIGEDVVTTDQANVRESAEVAENVVHTLQSGAEGNVANGYITEDGYTWWWVEFGNDIGGWTPQEKLESA